MSYPETYNVDLSDWAQTGVEAGLVDKWTNVDMGTVDCTLLSAGLSAKDKAPLQQQQQQSQLPQPEQHQSQEQQCLHFYCLC